MNLKEQFQQKVRNRALLIPLLMVILSIITVGDVFAQEAHSEPAVAAASNGSQMWGLIAAAVAFGFGAIGAGIAISSVGAAAMGAIGEKPEIAGQALIFVALAEGIVVFGFITALMILGKV